MRMTKQMQMQMRVDDEWLTPAADGVQPLVIIELPKKQDSFVFPLLLR